LLKNFIFVNGRVLWGFVYYVNELKCWLFSILLY
jgi:hypothetical protein